MCYSETMLLAYIDEFGHVGPYISPDHPKFKTHPIFGYSGFIIPAHNVRPLGGFFESTKANLLAYEIEKSGKHPQRWEKKGASLLTTKNMVGYGHEIKPALKRIFKKLYQLNGKVVFVGQVKPEGSLAETGEGPFDRSSHVLRQIIKEIAEYADHQNEDVLIFLDSVGTKLREKDLSVSASFIYSSNSPDAVKRVLEAPMQLESHFYGTTQFADWICALLGRTTHYHFVRSSQFSWAPQLLNDMLACSGDHSSTTVHSRIQPYQSNKRNKKSIKVGSLRRSDKYVDSFPRPLQNVGDMNPDLREFYKSLDKNRP